MTSIKKRPVIVSQVSSSNYFNSKFVDSKLIHITMKKKEEKGLWVPSHYKCLALVPDSKKTQISQSYK